MSGTHGNDLRKPCDVEDILRRMPLEEPSPALDRRILGMVAAGGRSRPALRTLAGLAAAAAAAAAVLALAWTGYPSAPKESAGERWIVSSGADAAGPDRASARRTAFDGPVRVERLISEQTDDGIVGVGEGAAVQRLRRDCVRQIMVVDPETRRQVDVSVPWREMVLVQVEPY